MSLNIDDNRIARSLSSLFFRLAFRPLFLGGTLFLDHRYCLVVVFLAKPIRLAALRRPHLVARS